MPNMCQPHKVAHVGTPPRFAGSCCPRTAVSNRRHPGEGSTRTLPSGRVQVRLRGPDGRYRSIGTFADDRKAERALRAALTDIDRGNWHDPSTGTTTLAVYGFTWVATRRTKGRPLTPRTRALYEWLLKKHILPLLGDVQLRR